MFGFKTRFEKDIDRRVDVILRVLKELVHLIGDMAMTLKELEVQVQANTDAEASAITLLEGLSALLAAAIATGDPAEVQAVADKLKASADALAAAVVANTPAV
jgi:hypothetical protein